MRRLGSGGSLKELSVTGSCRGGRWWNHCGTSAAFGTGQYCSHAQGI